MAVMIPETISDIPVIPLLNDTESGAPTEL